MKVTIQQQTTLLESVLDELTSVGVLSRFVERVEAFEVIQDLLKQIPLNFPSNTKQTNSNEFIYIALCHCTLLKNKAKEYDLNNTLQKVADKVELALTELID